MTDKVAFQWPRIFAVALLIGALFFAALPFIAVHRAYDTSISELAALLTRYQRAGASQDNLRSQITQWQEGAAVARRYLTGESPSLAAATLVDHASKVIESAGGQILSTQILPASPEEDFQKISIKVQMTGTVGVLKETFLALEGSTPLLFLDDVELRQAGPARRRARAGSVAQPAGALRIAFEVYGYIQPPDAEEAP